MRTCVAGTMGALPVSPQHFSFLYTLTCESMTLFMRTFESGKLPHPMGAEQPEALGVISLGSSPQAMTDRRYRTNSLFLYFFNRSFSFHTSLLSSPNLLLSIMSETNSLHSSPGSNCRAKQSKTLLISMFLYKNASLTPSGIPM